MDAMSRIETARSLFMLQNVKIKVNTKKMAYEVKTFESDETRKERNEFSRAK